MKIGALDHPKTIELSAQLGVCLPQAIGHLELLWAFVAQKTPQGNIGKWSDSVIAHAAQWTCDPSLFVQSLIESGFFDEDENYRILVHDWADHCPNWVRAKLKKEGKGFLSGDLSADLRKDLTSHYKPSQAKPSKSNMSDSSESDAFEEIWKQKPNRPNQSKAKTKKAYNARLKESITHADLLAGLIRYNTYTEAEGTAPQFIKQLSTFLNADEHWKEPYTIAQQIPPVENGAAILKMAEDNGVRLPDNCTAYDARKILSKELRMAL